MNARRLICFALLAACSLSAAAHEYYAKDFTLIHPWAEPTEPDAKEAAVYLSFEQVTQNDRLLSAETRFAGRVELHSGPEKDAAKQAPLKAIDIGPDKPSELAPGGRYLLLRDLTVPLQFGRSYDLTLRFEKAGEMQVMVSIGAH